jgi:hypothetical protein
VSSRASLPGSPHGLPAGAPQIARSRSGRIPDPVALAPLLLLAALAAAVQGNGPVPLRLVLTLVVATTVPGAAIVGSLRLPPSPAQVLLTVGTSIATTTLVAGALVLAGDLTPLNTLLWLTIITAPFVVATLLSSRQHPRTRRDLRHLVAVSPRPAALTGTAALLWIVAVVQVDPTDAGKLGMLTALPVTWWLGVAVLSTAFVVHLRREVHPLLAGAQVALLVGFLFATLTLSEAYARIPTSYTHVGLVDYLVRDHRVVAHFDARFSWPGSISFGAALTQLSGVGSSAAFVKWAIPAMVGLWCLAVFAVARCFTTDRRVPWITLWLFLLLDWVGQDYWSPQAVNFFLTLVVIAAAATWLPRRILRARNRWLPFEQPDDAITTSAQAVGVVFCITVIVAAVAASHQLSPFITIGALAVLWLFDRRDLRLLPVLALVLTVAWISWGAYDYWIGHFDRLTKDVGQVSGVVTAGTANRLDGGSAARLVVLGTRLLLSIGAWAGAIAALVALRRRLPAAAAVGALVVMPFGTVALQSYGGELGLRIFLFGLPFVALLLAEGVRALAPRWQRRPALAVVALVALVVPFVIARYGNEQFEQTYREDMAAVHALYEVATPGDVVLSANTANAFRRGPYKSYRFYRQPLLVDPAVDLEAALAAAKRPRGFVLLTRAGANQAALTRGVDADWDRSLGVKLEAFGAVERFRDGRAAVYEYTLTAEALQRHRQPAAPKRPVKTATSLVGWPALWFVVAVAAYLFVFVLLHAAGVRWRRGWPEVLAVVACAGAVLIVAARFLLLT